MTNITVINNVVNNQIINAPFNLEERSIGKFGGKIYSEILTSEGCDNFISYIEWLGIINEAEIVVLPSKQHYYYDEIDLKSVRILINLRKLNLIKQLDVFLNTLVNILPPDANFIGYFSDSKTIKLKGFQLNRHSRLFDRLNNFLDSRTDHIMNKSEVTQLLERNGFKVINMTNINGLTYFYSRNIQRYVA